MNKNFGKYAAATVIYVSFAIYLYQPYFKNFNKFQYLIILNACLASLGCFLLSQRWVSVFAGSFFAGAIYGFGPFMLGLNKFHPAAGFLAASIPWLFYPATFGPKYKWRWLSWPFSTLPFLAIPLFFKVATYFRLFAIPLQTRLSLIDLVGLFVPIVKAKQNTALIGFYHVPLAALVVGFSMLVAARRFGVMIILILGIILAFCNPLFNTSPIIWIVIPTLVCSILIGEGIQGLILAGPADKKLLLIAAIMMGALSLITLLLATKYSNTFASLGAEYAKLFTETAKIYTLGAITVAILYFIARAGLRLRWLRLILLCSTVAIYIFLCTRFIVDRIF